MTVIKYKVPSQASSGAETFSDAIVGLQITNGTNQLTNANFNIDRNIPEKDVKDFRNEPFSEYMSFDELKSEEFSSTINEQAVSDDKVKFKNSKENGNVSLYGSLKQKLAVSISNILNKFPGGIYVDITTPSKFTEFTAENIKYNTELNNTEFNVEKSLFFNPFNITLNEPNSFILPVVYNNIRNFFASYTKYIIDVNGKTYNIKYYVEANDKNLITFTVDGNCFSGLTEYNENYLIRPNNDICEGFYNSLNDLESVLLNRDIFPKYTSQFNVLDDDNNIIVESVTWPTSYDNWNIKIDGSEFINYIDSLNTIGESIDNFKSNLIVRFLTTPQLFEFDTDEKKMESIFQIYGQSFDDIKKYIDNIKYMRNITYDGVNNIPDIFLKRLSETLGLSTVSLFNENKTSNIKTRYDSTYNGISTGLNLVESEYEYYRRLLNNIVYLFKSKGTIKNIQFLLKFIGVSEHLTKIDEYVYRVVGELPTNNLEDDISSVVSGVKHNRIAVYNSGITGYTVSSYITGTELYRNQYPVDENTGLPRKLVSTKNDMFFSKGAGWFRQTKEHRSSEILDIKNSNLTDRIKTIKTKSKPFTYGEDYFDNFRKLPGLNYGYNLISEIDNKKCHVVNNDYESGRILNRKNLNVFLSSASAINYDMFRKYDTEISFEEFNTYIKNTYIDIKNDKYENSYSGLTTIYTEYQDNFGVPIYTLNNDIINTDNNNVLYASVKNYKPYNYIVVNDYINQLTTNWVEIIQQFIPATTLWLTGNLIENTMFGRPKYKHKINSNTNKTSWDI